MKRRPQDESRQCGGFGLHIFRATLEGETFDWNSAHDEREARSIFEEDHAAATILNVERETLRGEELLTMMRAHGRLDPKPE